MLNVSIESDEDQNTNISIKNYCKIREMKTYLGKDIEIVEGFYVMEKYDEGSVED